MESLLFDIDALVHLTTFIHIHSDMILRQHMEDSVTLLRTVSEVEGR